MDVSTGAHETLRVRMIGKEDVEFYHGGSVTIVARTLATKPWDELTFRARQRILDKAVLVVQALLNNSDTQRTFQTARSR